MAGCQVKIFETDFLKRWLIRRFCNPPRSVIYLGSEKYESRGPAFGSFQFKIRYHLVTSQLISLYLLSVYGIKLYYSRLLALTNTERLPSTNYQIASIRLFTVIVDASHDHKEERR